MCWKEGYFVIMVSALVLESQNGFVIGAITALVSNIFLGQGPWTPWQMYAWGMVGLSVGAMRHTLFMKNKWLRMLYGLAICYFFGWFMNLWAILGSNLPLTCDLVEYFRLWGFFLLLWFGPWTVECVLLGDFCPVMDTNHSSFQRKVRLISRDLVKGVIETSLPYKM